MPLLLAAPPPVLQVTGTGVPRRSCAILKAAGRWSVPPAWLSECGKKSSVLWPPVSSSPLEGVQVWRFLVECVSGRWVVVTTRKREGTEGLTCCDFRSRRAWDPRCSVG